MKPILFFILSTWVPFAAALTVQQIFEAAKQKNEDLAIQSENVTQSEERYKQTRGGVLPKVSGSLSYLWQDQTTAPTGNTNTAKYQPTHKLTASQALFRGFREFKGLSQAKHEIRNQEELRKQAEYELFKAVTAQAYNILALQKDHDFLSEQMKLYDERVKDLNRYVNLGRTRPSEVLTVRTNRSLLESQVEQASTQLVAARESLTAITGLPSDTPIEDSPDPAVSALKPLDYYISRRDQRPDVRANEEALIATEKAVGVAKGSHLPSVDLNYNHYLERTGSLREVEWDAQLLVTVPIFEGGATQARVREVSSIENQARLLLTQAQREADTEIRAVHAAVASGFRQLGQLNETVSLARQSFERERRDYRNGLVTNLEVLSALQTVTEAQRSLNRIRYNLKLDFARLKAAAALDASVTE